MHYVCRELKSILWNPEEDAESKLEMLIYQTCQCCPEFREDNKNAYGVCSQGELHRCSLAYKHIKKYKVEQNGQDTMKALRDLYESINKRNKCSSVAIQNIGNGRWGLTYHLPSWSS